MSRYEEEDGPALHAYAAFSFWFSSYFCRGEQTRSLPACPAAPRGPRHRSWEPLCWLVTGNPGRPGLQQQTYQWADSNTQPSNTWLFHSTIHTNTVCVRQKLNRGTGNMNYLIIGLEVSMYKIITLVLNYQSALHLVTFCQKINNGDMSLYI